MDAVIRERDDSCPRFPDEEEALAGDERVGGGQLLLLLHRRPHREHLGSLHHCEHNLHRRLSGKQIVKFTSQSSPLTIQSPLVQLIHFTTSAPVITSSPKGLQALESRVPSLPNPTSFFLSVSLFFGCWASSPHASLRAPYQGLLHLRHLQPPVSPMLVAPSPISICSSQTLFKKRDLLCIPCCSSAFFSEKNDFLTIF